MSLSIVRTLSGLGQAISLAARYAAGLLMLASAARHGAAILPLRPLADWTSRDWSQAQAAVLVLIAALWFLLPALFARSLAALRSGRGRLVAGFLFLAVLVYLVSFALWLIADRGSPLRGRVTEAHLIYAFATFAVTYVYAFILPGRAFDGAASDDVPQATFIPTGPVRIRRSLGVGQMLRSLLFLGLLMFWAAGLLGVYHAPWLPDAALLARVEDLWPYLAGGIALLSFAVLAGIAPGHGADGWRRTRGRRRLFATFGAILSVAVVTPALTRGLPWAASFLPPAETGSVEVIVRATGRGACSHTASAVAGTAPGREILLCAVPEDIRAGLGSGDRLRLDGVRTAYGLRYAAMTRP